MLRRKIESKITDYLKSGSNKMLLVEGARQIGKSFIIRHIGKELFPNFIELNMETDRLHDKIFADARTVDSFYFALSSVAGDRMGTKEDTLIFIDEIQAYDHLLTLVKFLLEDNRFTFIASGSLLGVTLQQTNSVPVGSLQIENMYPLDFEEFLWANNVGSMAIAEMKQHFINRESLPIALHEKMMDLFKRYLLIGGMPDAVNVYLEEHNIVKVREVQQNILQLYKADATKYESEASGKLLIRRIYDMIPANMITKRKRIQVSAIEDKKGKRTSDYQEEFDYLVSSGIALETDAISTPTYPLTQNAGKNLLKLYLNDVGLLTNILYGSNIQPIMKDMRSINLGSVYETVTAQELKAHGFKLYYYDNKKNGEVDFLIDYALTASVLPIEVKSGKDYKIHSALDRFLENPDYNIHEAVVLCNDGWMQTDSGIFYTPIYNLMFIERNPELPLADTYV